MGEASTYLPRDISWLYFNGRVLEEAADKSMPIYERIKFLGIFSSNLDEFYRVRVAELRSLEKLGKKKLEKKLGFSPDQVLDQIREIVHNQQTLFGSILKEDVLPELQQQDIHLIYNVSEIPEAIKPELRHYFRSRVLSYLQPVVLRENSRVYLSNQSLYLLLKIFSESTGEWNYAIVNIPSDTLDRFYRVSDGSRHYIVFLDDIIRLYLDQVFSGYRVSEGFCLKLNRDADLEIDDEYSGSLVTKIRQNLKKRNIGPPSRLLYDGEMPLDFFNAVLENFDISEGEMVTGGRYHNLADLMALENPKSPSLESPRWPPLEKSLLSKASSLFEEIEKRDILLHFPYHSYDYVLRFFNEAAIDPWVTEIKATFYRVASDSFIVNALISAARNGKKVKAFIEVKARFDEENNLRWAKKMKEAGVKITYSIPGLKVHAKAALVHRIGENGEKKSFGFFGTGNFNEKTAGIYSDMALFTTNESLNVELDRVFRYIYKQKPVEKAFKHLLVSQFNLPQRFKELIDREIEQARKGNKAQVVIKVNNMEDPVMIDKLYEASMAGVQIHLIIRGICCLRPQCHPFSSNIHAYRIVDRFLEHARVFVFHNGGAEEIYLGSADFMRRNLYHRIEVVFPVVERELKKQIHTYIAFQLNDNDKSRIIDENGQNSRVLKKNEARKVRAQESFYLWLKQLEEAKVATELMEKQT